MKDRAREPEPFTRFRDGTDGEDGAVAALFRAVSEPEALGASELARVRRRLARETRSRGRKRAREAIMIAAALLSGVGVAFGGWGIVEWTRSPSAKRESVKASAPPSLSASARPRRPQTSVSRAPGVSSAFAEPETTAAPKSRRPTPSAETSAAPRTVASVTAESALSRESQALTAALVALRRQRDPRAALAALDAYDAEFPNGALRLEARIARVDAWIAAGDCARALGAVDRLVDGAAPAAVQERALYARASCRLRVGNRPGAESDFRRYLASYPSGRYVDEVTKLLGTEALR